MSETVTVIAKLVAKPEAITEVKIELLKMVDPTRQEEGCLTYRLHQDNEDPALFLFYEIWENIERLIAHTQTRHYCEYAAAVEGKIAERVVQKMTCLR